MGGQVGAASEASASRSREVLDDLSIGCFVASAALSTLFGSHPVSSVTLAATLVPLALGLLLVLLRGAAALRRSRAHGLEILLSFVGLVPLVLSFTRHDQRLPTDVVVLTLAVALGSGTLVARRHEPSFPRAVVVQAALALALSCLWLHFAEARAFTIIRVGRTFDAVLVGTVAVNVGVAIVLRARARGLEPSLLGPLVVLVALVGGVASTLAGAARHRPAAHLADLAAVGLGSALLAAVLVSSLATGPRGARARRGARAILVGVVLAAIALLVRPGPVPYHELAYALVPPAEPPPLLEPWPALLVLPLAVIVLVALESARALHLARAGRKRDPDDRGTVVVPHWAHAADADRVIGGDRGSPYRGAGRTRLVSSRPVRALARSLTRWRVWSVEEGRHAARSLALATSLVVCLGAAMVLMLVSR